MYTIEKNIQILIALLKANNIKRVIASPGATNLSFVGSLQNDPYFEIYSAVDERSAAYMACGMAAESGEPVVLSCTGATASRNYYPGLTEAFYRKLPVLAVTSHQGYDRIGHLVPQNIDRREQPNDLVKLSVTLPIVKDERDENYVLMEANRAILALSQNGGGPVHIDMFTTYDTTLASNTLPEVRAIKMVQAWDKFPELPKGNIGIYVGSHRTFTKAQNEAIDKFCGTYDAVVICDHTSGYYGPYRVQPILYLNQPNATSELPDLDLMIHIGEVSAVEGMTFNKAKQVWRVNEDGELRDTFKKLTMIFKMPPEFFFRKYVENIPVIPHKTTLLNTYKAIVDPIYKDLPDIPFSNVYVAKTLSKMLPKGSIFHLGVSNTRRCWNQFSIPEGVETACNVGCCGIDGCTSALIGASLIENDRICFVAVGDLTFFYDLNCLGNRHVGANVRILLVNNGIGTEFKMPHHPCRTFGEKANDFMAAEGHFGNKSKTLVKHYASDLGFEYLSASNKEEFLEASKRFVIPEMTDKPMLFEVFTDYCDESEAMDIMRHLRQNTEGLLKNKVRSIIGEKGVHLAKKILK